MNKPHKKTATILAIKNDETTESPNKTSTNSKAGGKMTTLNGKLFENKTNNEVRLKNNGYTEKRLNESGKYNYYLSKTLENNIKITFLIQQGLKKYMKNQYDIDIHRYPDEAYIIEHNEKKILKILEKKAQCVEGSVEGKLWSGHGFLRDYQLQCKDFEVTYCFCVNDFLKTKILSDTQKYKNLNIIWKELNISVLFGEDDNYFETLDRWILSNLE